MDKKEFRVRIKYCLLKGNNTVEAKTCLDAEFRDIVPGKSTIKDWYAKFRRGKMGTEDGERNGYPKETIHPVKNHHHHPPYSPDLAPSDYFPFSDLKRMLAGKKFSSNEEVIDETEAYFDAKKTSYYKNGIQKLEGLYNQCITFEGNYVE
ncbi:hypothetical protein GWI33_023194 [Rhynchophorus ferrugineus]|uniref:Mos1 transposase HTH domain-containing protein n=1 Tax=Rhynchophorus ferrugineus TaxID=354439 RepID=A0A834IRH0_RHYFE|nr:hypothetical protein GWI33_023194 [Rhynchophorus ferrugineus]